MKPWIKPVEIRRFKAQPIVKVDGVWYRARAVYLANGQEYETYVDIPAWKIRDSDSDIEAWVRQLELAQLPKPPTDPRVSARRRKVAHGIRGRYRK